MKGWHRTDKRMLAFRIAGFLSTGLTEAEIAEFVGKSRVRVYQVVKLFSLRDPERRAALIAEARE